MTPQNDDILKKTDIQKIAQDGARIYEKIKIQYDPQEKGKSLAIDVESEDVYLANTSAEALELARKAHPNRVFYVIKIGYDVAETLAKLYLEKV